MIVFLGVLLIALPIIGVTVVLVRDAGIKDTIIGFGFTALISTPIMIGAYLLEYAGVLK